MEAQPVWNTQTLTALAVRVANKHGLNADHFVHTIECESTWKIHAKGDDGNSRGLVQISSIYHPEVSDTEADDPRFAIEWMAKKWDEGHQTEWSCWRKLYGRGY